MLKRGNCAMSDKWNNNNNNNHHHAPPKIDSLWHSRARNSLKLSQTITILTSLKLQTPPYKISYKLLITDHQASNF